MSQSRQIWLFDNGWSNSGAVCGFGFCSCCCVYLYNMVSTISTMLCVHVLTATFRTHPNYPAVLFGDESVNAKNLESRPASSFFASALSDLGEKQSSTGKITSLQFLWIEDSIIEEPI